MATFEKSETQIVWVLASLFLNLNCKLKNYNLKNFRDAIIVLQKVIRMYMNMRLWLWWKLWLYLKPLCTSGIVL